MTTEAQQTAPPPSLTDDTTSPTHRRRTVAFIVVGVLLVAAAGGAGWARHNTAVKVEAATAATATAVAAWSAADRNLDAAVSEAEMLVSSASDKVDDPATITELTAALTAARAVAEQDGPAPVAAGVGLDEARATQRVAQAALREQEEVAGSLAAAIAAVKASLDAKQLKDASASAAAERAQLSEVMATGESVYAGSDGQVDDAAVREALRAALDAAAKVRDAKVAATLDAQVQAAKDLTATRNSVTAATTAVTEAQKAWTAKQPPAAPPAEKEHRVEPQTADPTPTRRAPEAASADPATPAQETPVAPPAQETPAAPPAQAATPTPAKETQPPAQPDPVPGPTYDMNKVVDDFLNGGQDECFRNGQRVDCSVLE